MTESVSHFTFQVVHETISFVRGLLFKILQSIACHVSGLGEHIIKVSQAFLTRPLLVLDVSMHLGTFFVNVGHDLLLICDSSPFLLDQAICDTFDLGSNRIQGVIMVLDAVFFFLDNGSLELIPMEQADCVIIARTE